MVRAALVGAATETIPKSTGKRKRKAVPWWSEECSVAVRSLGRVTPVGEVWGMIKRISGVRREWDYPVLVSGEVQAVTDGEKAEMLAQAFVRVHSSENLSMEGRRGRQETTEQFGAE
ncbi:hypothetical protein DPEC_G00099930 [Dallia pectoralis]|uniref:Uncharacterized protein n=1 Tax=Dallia pectoralis TaxID=75939 RepID=A0ACC2GW99_DALPE|nr:hypothetical protein DPEC_G00099930 [Dallia pectoralis]